MSALSRSSFPRAQRRALRRGKSPGRAAGLIESTQRMLRTRWPAKGTSTYAPCNIQARSSAVLAASNSGPAE